MNSISQPPRIGVIGAGNRMHHVLERMRAQALPVVLTAVYDPSAAAIARFHKELAPGAAVCDSVEQLCARTDVDWVFIGSWNCFHAAQVQAAFAAGKHVFCEKPLALSIADAHAMRDAQKACGKTFALGLVLRYSPLYRKAKALLEDGAIGQLVSFEFNETLGFNHGGYIHGNWRRKTEYAGTHLLEKCCHDIDLALWLTESVPSTVASFGGCNFFRPENRHCAAALGASPVNGRPAYQTWPDPDGVNPFGTDKDIVDNQVAIWQCTNGVRATFHTNCNAGIPERRFYMLGTEGTLRLDAMTGNIEVKRIGWDTPTQTYDCVPGGGHVGGDDIMATELIDVLYGKRAPAAGFTQGVRSLALANAIDQSMREGRMIDITPTWAMLKDGFGTLFPTAQTPA